MSFSGLQAQPGANTPKELLQKSAKAIQKKDYNQFKTFYSATTPKDKQELESTIALLQLSSSIKTFLQQGRAKYGMDDFNDGLSYGEFILDGLANPPDYKKAAESGKITIKGNKADVTVSSKSTDGVAMSQKTTLIKKRDKWFYQLDGGTTQIYTSVKVFLNEGTLVLKEAKNKKEMQKEVKALVDKHFKDL